MSEAEKSCFLLRESGLSGDKDVSREVAIISPAMSVEERKKAGKFSLGDKLF